MAPHAIIIGFTYTHLVIPGVIPDISLVYNFFYQRGFTLTVISDIEQRKFIQNNPIPLDSLLYWFKVLSVDDLTSAVKRLRRSSPLGDGRFVLYFSGHGISRGIVLPDQSVILSGDFRDMFINIIQPKGDRSLSFPAIGRESLWIFDCCNPGGLNLPFIWKNSTTQQGDGYFSLCERDDFLALDDNILLVTSSREDEKAVSTEMGSLFTYLLFKFLSRLTEEGSQPKSKKMYSWNFGDILAYIQRGIKRINSGHPQTVSLYGSHVISPVLWPWVFSPNNIRFDEELLSFVVVPDKGR